MTILIIFSPDIYDFIKSRQSTADQLSISELPSAAKLFSNAPKSDFSGQVFLLADNYVKQDQVIPWNKNIAKVTLKSDAGTFVGLGTISSSGTLSLKINHQAKIQAYSFKHMLDDQNASPSNTTAKKTNTFPTKYKCDYSKLKISDSNLKIRSGHLSLKNEMPLLGITTKSPSTEQEIDYLDLLFADRDAKLKGIVDCKFKLKSKYVTQKHEFNIKLKKGWNFFKQATVPNKNGDLNSIYKTASKPQNWVTISASSPIHQ